MTDIVNQIRAMQDRTIKKLDNIPGWPGITLYIKTLSGRDVFKYQQIREDKNKDWKPYLIIWSACDEAGNKIFDESKHIEMLSDKSIKAINYLIDEINDLILINDDELEDKVKN